MVDDSCHTTLYVMLMCILFFKLRSNLLPIWNVFIYSCGFHVPVLPIQVVMRSDVNA